MNAYYTSRLLAIALASSVLLTGYSLTSTGVDLEPAPGQVVIRAGIPIRQGTQAEYTFLEDTVLDKLKLTSAYLEIDEIIRFGTQVAGSGQVNVSLHFWDPDTSSGRVLLWNASSADEVTATFSIYSPSFATDHNYQVTVDGVEAAEFRFDSSRAVSLSWAIWSDHLFEILIPDISDDTADDDDGTDGGGTGSPAAPISVTGLDPYAWALFALIASSIVVIMVVMVSRSRKGRGGRSHV